MCEEATTTQRSIRPFIRLRFPFRQTSSIIRRCRYNVGEPTAPQPSESIAAPIELPFLVTGQKREKADILHVESDQIDDDGYSKYGAQMPTPLR